MGKFISNLFLGALAIGLSIFTGSRTLDLLAWALPANQVIYQWLGLAAFELGMYFWTFYFIAGAKGTPQRSIAVCMAVFSIVAVAIATITDMSLDAGQAGKIAPLSPAMSQAAIIFLGVVIALNVAAFLACKLLSIDNMRLMREQSAEDTIHEAGLRAITAIAPSIADAAAPHLATEWADRTWQRLVPGVHGRTEIVSYRATQNARRIAPSAGLPLVEDEETALRRPIKSLPRQKRRGFLGLFGGGRPAPAVHERTEYFPAHAKWAQEQDEKVLTPRASEKTSNQQYREDRRRAAMPSVARQRQIHREQRFQRTVIDPILESIDTEEMPTLPLKPEPTGRQAGGSQTQSTQKRGSTGKKPASARTTTRAK